jgi:transposase
MSKRKRLVSMRKIREILRLSMCHGMGSRDVARSCSVSHTVVNKYTSRARDAGVDYSRLEEMDDEDLRRLLSPGRQSKAVAPRPLPDWGWVDRELRSKGVTLQLLWEEYRGIHPEGYGYTQFCEYYRRWKRKLDVTMRQGHKAGEKMFVDYAGQTVPIIDGKTGEVKEAEVFVAVLGASNYTYAEATWDQSLRSWISSHINAFEYMGGVAEVIVPDNLKSGVRKACRYEPDLNPTYHEMAAYYGAAVIPTRVGKPRDKAKVESGVLVVERWILAALRNRTFFSLVELNEAIRELLKELNHRPFKKLEGSRASWFESVDRPALKPLPRSRYEYAEWKKARVNIDYHVDVEGHYYSVPYQLVHEEVEIRHTASTVEVFRRGRRVASHKRDGRRGRHTTCREHMPKSHRRHLDWTPSRIIRWARKVGPSCEHVVSTVLNKRPHPEQGFRSCLGILRLEKTYSRSRLEAACTRAAAIRGYSYRSVKSILDKGLDGRPLPEEAKEKKAIVHENIRGGAWTHEEIIVRECL